MEKSIARKLYERYQLDWMIQHGYSVNDLIHEIDEEEKDFDGNASAEEIYGDWEFGTGFGGSLWVYFDEFLDNEFKETEYMHSLCQNDAEKAEYDTVQRITTFVVTYRMLTENKDIAEKTVEFQLSGTDDLDDTWLDFCECYGVGEGSIIRVTKDGEPFDYSIREYRIGFINSDDNGDETWFSLREGESLKNLRQLWLDFCEENDFDHTEVTDVSLYDGINENEDDALKDLLAA